MFLPKPSSEEIVASISRMKINAGDVALIMIGEEHRPDVAGMIAALNAQKIDFLGGIFPGVIYGDQKHTAGAVIKILPALARPFLIRGLNTEHIALPDFRGQISGAMDRKYTAIILLDGLTSNISLFLSEMFNRLGNSVHYFGGGAGSLSLKQEPCLFCPEGFFQDVALVAFIKLESNLGVRHGWQKIMGPIVATKTHKNVITELNWQNAFEVYREPVERDAGKTMNPENFFSIAKGYPFGIYKEGAEDIVRDPIMVNDKGELICVGEVPENTVLHILKGETGNLVQAAGQAVDDCQNLGGKKMRHALVADCISRVLFLEDDFKQELAMVKNKMAAIGGDSVPSGMLTLGEISSYGEGLLEFFNKTIVTGVFYE